MKQPTAAEFQIAADVAIYSAKVMQAKTESLPWWKKLGGRYMTEEALRFAATWREMADDEKAKEKATTCP